jgi:hypothetical protein
MALPVALIAPWLPTNAPTPSGPNGLNKQARGNDNDPHNDREHARKLHKVDH